MYGRGTVMAPALDCPTYESTYGEAGYVETVGVYNEEKEEFTVFAVNRNLTDEVEMKVDLRDFEGFVPVDHHIITGAHMKVTNTADEPWNVLPMILPLPAMDGCVANTELPPTPGTSSALPRRPSKMKIQMPCAKLRTGHFWCLAYPVLPGEESRATSTRGRGKGDGD